MITMASVLQTTVGSKSERSRYIMKVKLFVQAIAVAAAFAAPAITFAQSSAPLTRAQVRAELVQIEKAGYRPGDGDQSTYPQDLQRAEARLAAQSATTSAAAAPAAPAATAAQSNAPLTRAEVRGQLVQIEQAGYRPGDGDESTYPQDFQRAEARLAQSAAAANDVGGATAGSSASGQASNAAPQAEIPGLKPIYFGQ
jgi:hypothetical protein